MQMTTAQRTSGNAHSLRRVRVAASLLFACVLLWAMLCQTSVAAERVIVYPRTESTVDRRTEFPLAVLDNALRKSGMTYRLQPTIAMMPQSRSLKLLQQGRDLDVVWTVSDRRREADLRAVRIPIDSGLIGWRVLLIQSGDQDRFRNMTTAADLAGIRFGQGHDWPDVAVLRANGLDVSTSSSYEGLFAMLAKGHIHAFPRAVTEVGAELAARPDHDLVVESNLLLIYPSALCFFVHPGDEALATALEQGLAQSYRDGSHERLMREHYAESLAALSLDRRRVIRLRNPDLAVGTLTAHPEWWLQSWQAP